MHRKATHITARMQCWCLECDQAEALDALAANDLLAAASRIRMNLCPECGDKRCPRATSHDLACSGSAELVAQVAKEKALAGIGLPAHLVAVDQEELR